MGIKRTREPRRVLRPVSRRERLLSLVLLVLLPLIGAAIYLDGQHFDPRLYSLDLASLGSPARTPAAAPAPAAAVAPAPSPAAGGADRSPLPDTIADLDWKADGGAESFTPATLYEKINGGAEVYVQHGFRGLQCRSYTDAQGQQFIDVFVYDMGTPASASAMFTLQRPPDAANVAVGEEAYRASGSVFARQDRYYVQVVAGAAGAAMERASLALARSVASGLTGPKAGGSGESRP